MENIIMAITGAVSLLIIAFLVWRWKKIANYILIYIRPEIYNQITDEDIIEAGEPKKKPDFSKNEKKLKKLQENDNNYIPDAQILKALILNEIDTHKKMKNTV